MSKELNKTYSPNDIENKWYPIWEEKGYFKPNMDLNSEKFSIVMPPPNVTGRLHMGHAMDDTMQDILIRFKRLQGYNTLWLPGTDHAGIATQAKVEKQIRDEGLSKNEMGREKFLERCWKWKEEYGNAISQQIRKLGASCDWSRERFTMDEVCSRAVRESFVKLYKKDLIYQGDYIVNWCPHCQTTISDIEVEHKENHGQLYYLNYFLEDYSGFLTIATTRPETIFGDVAVAVHPNDERYINLVGKKVILPIINRKIPIISDEYVDQEFGTGVVKITPSHDVNDFEIGCRHNLPNNIVIDQYGKMTDGAGPYEGMDRFECRKKLISDLEGTDTLAKIENYVNSVGHCYRCDTVIEPRVSKQWFVSMKPLAKPALEAVKNGDIRFIPERFTKIYIGWLENIRDWCISRQLWWGHRIPVWYCKECGETICENEDPEICPNCNSPNIEQDEDVLDTWFSSGLWPFEVFGWPDETDELKMFYPTSVLVTGRDIIFFWVARMIFDAYEFSNQKPFNDVLIHGLVLDDQGRKMSKSLGNGIDPLDEIDKYGADAMRMTLVTGTTPGNDTRYRQEKIEAARNFTNKLWNAARFVMMNINYDEIDSKNINPFSQNVHDQWIVSKFVYTAKQVTNYFEKYELGEASKAITNFIWDEFCDWYIELSKPRLYGNYGEEARKEAEKIATWILRESCVLLHPIMPFITEEIWQKLPHDGETIMLSNWPSRLDSLINEQSVNDVELVMDIIRTIRSLRHDMNVTIGHKAPIELLTDNKSIEKLLNDNKNDFLSLAFASEVNISSSSCYFDEEVVSAVSHGVQILLPLKGLINLEEEIIRLKKEANRIDDEINRATNKLSNKNFIDKAPLEIVEKEKEKLAEYQSDAKTIAIRIEQLSKL